MRMVCQLVKFDLFQIIFNSVFPLPALLFNGIHAADNHRAVNNVRK
jgi:hypothetical protein